MPEELNLEDRIKRLEERVRLLEHDRASKAQLAERNPERFPLGKQLGKVAYPEEKR